VRDGAGLGLPTLSLKMDSWRAQWRWPKRKRLAADRAEDGEAM
jgi:hypothetical protein